MKTIRKTTAALLAGIMALTSGVVGISGSAANHARVAVHDPSISTQPKANICQWNYWGAIPA